MSETIDSKQELKWLETMLLIRRFEERAGQMYSKAKVGGFLHLAIGEEATVVGTVSAMRSSDYLLSTYREHGQALARGLSPNVVMAELFGKETGCSRGRGGSMHLFDYEKRFFGGYGIVGGHLPIAAGVALKSSYKGEDDVTVCMFGDGASNQGTFGETMNLASLWNLPVVFVVVNNQFGMGTALERHSAVTDLKLKGESFGVHGTSCNGMDVHEVNRTISEAIEIAREQKTPRLVEAITYRFRGHSMADPEEYRSKQQVELWRKKDPINTLSIQLKTAGAIDDEQIAAVDALVTERVDAAVQFAEESPFPSEDSLYDDVYVLGDQIKAWYSVDSRSAETNRGEDTKQLHREGKLPKHEGAEGAIRGEDVGRSMTDATNAAEQPRYTETEDDQ